MPTPSGKPEFYQSFEGVFPTQPQQQEPWWQSMSQAQLPWQIPTPEVAQPFLETVGDIVVPGAGTGRAMSEGDMGTGTKIGAAFDFFPFGGVVPKLGVKAAPSIAKQIPDALAAAGGFMSGWNMPKKKVTQATRRLEDIWSHPLWTKGKVEDVPDAEEIRRIGGEAMGIKTVVMPGSTGTYHDGLAFGRGNFPTVQARIRHLQAQNPTAQTLKQSDTFNKRAKEVIGDLGSEQREITYEWLWDRLDQLEEFYEFNGDLLRSGKGSDSQIAAELRRISDMLKGEAKGKEKWLNEKIGKILDEELSMMERGMAEITGGQGVLD